jgi:hypothetical protein
MSDTDIYRSQNFGNRIGFGRKCALLVVDFVRGSGKGLRAHFHRHGRVDPRDLITLVTGAGLTVIESGPVGRWDLQFVLARRDTTGVSHV